MDVGFLRDVMVHHDQAVTMAASELWRGEYVQMAERLDSRGVASAEPGGKAMACMGMSVKVEDMPKDTTG